jgi:hypothetical protein
VRPAWDLDLVLSPGRLQELAVTRHGHRYLIDPEPVECDLPCRGLVRIAVLPSALVIVLL